MNDKKSQRITLAVDLDEVCFNYIGYMRQWLMNEHGIQVPKEDPHSWNLIEAGWFDSDESFFNMHSLAVDDGLYEKLEMIKGASSTLWGLSRAGYDINIITARFIKAGLHYKVVEQTVKALDKNRIPYNSISFLANKTLQYADAYIDDSPRNVIALRDLGRYVICMNMPYNLSVENVERASNWSEIRQKLYERFGR